MSLAELSRILGPGLAWDWGVALDRQLAAERETRPRDTRRKPPRDAKQR